MSAEVLLVDSSDSVYLHPAKDVSLDRKGLSAVFGAVTGFASEPSQQVETLVKLNPFQHPKAALLVNLLGLSSAEPVISRFQGRTAVRAELIGSENVDAEQSVHSALASLAKSNSDFKLDLLDQTSLKNCMDSCMLTLLSDVCSVIGCQLSSNGKHLQDSRLLFKDAEFDLSSRPALLFAIEIASFYGAAKQHVDKGLARIQAEVPQEDVEILESTLAGVQALLSTYSAESPEIRTAEVAVLSVLEWAKNQFDALYGGDILYQVGLLGQPTANSLGIERLVAQRENFRRQLQEASLPPDDDDSMRVFTTKATAYGAFIIITYFSLAAVYCMCTMKFKQDSLLYSRTKTD